MPPYYERTTITLREQFIDAYCTSIVEDTINIEHLAQASKEVPSTSGTSIKGKKKKRTQDKRIEGALQTVVKDVVQAQQKSDKMFFGMGREKNKI